MDSGPTHQWATLDVSEDELASNDSETEDEVDEIQKTSSPSHSTNVTKRSRDVLAGPSERPQKRPRHSPSQGGSSSRAGRDAQPVNQVPHRGPVLGSSISARQNELTRRPAQRKVDTSPNDSDSGSSDIMIIDKPTEAGRGSTSQNVPKRVITKPSNAPAAKSQSNAHVEISTASSGDDDETSSSSPVRPPTQRVAKKTVKGIPPNVKGKAPANPPPKTAKGKEAVKALHAPSSSKGPVKPCPSQIIEVSSGDDSDEVVSRPFKQVARKKTGAVPPERVKIRPRVSDAEPKASSSGSGSGVASQSVSAPPGGPKAPEVTWTDFIHMMGKSSKTTNAGPSKSKPNAGPNSAGPSVSVKPAPKSPQKIPSGNLDDFIERSKRPTRPAASSKANDNGEVDMRPLSEALGLPKKSLAARKEEKRKEVLALEKKVSELSKLKPFSSHGDVAAAIESAGRNNSQNFTSSKKLKEKRLSLPSSSVAIDPTKGTSNAPIDLTLSDDEPPPLPQRKVPTSSLPSSTTAPPLPSRKTLGSQPIRPDVQPQSAPSSAATTPPPVVSQFDAIPPPVSAPPLPSRVSVVAGTTRPSSSAVAARPSAAYVQRSPARRHSMPSGPEALLSANDQPGPHAITRIASPLPPQDQISSAPPGSPISIGSSVPSRAMSPRPSKPLPKPLTPPRLDASRALNSSTVQSTPLASQPVPLPIGSLPSLLPPEAPRDVPHNQTAGDSLFTEDESEGEMPHHHVPVDSLFSDAEEDDSPTTANRSDVDAEIEVEALMEPPTRDVSHELDDVTQALGTQTLKTASPSEASAGSDPNRPSTSRPITPAGPSDDGFDDFYVSESDDPLSLPQAVPPLVNSGSVSSRGSEPRTPGDTHDLPVAVAGKSYGGFAALTFDNWRDEYQVEVKYFDELPAELHNYINDLDEHYRMSGDMRQVLQASISYNTRDDEPDAPPIEIINHIDNEPTPPFEFYYTNKMYHGPDVPPPDVADLKGCDCVGKCDPRSKTCQCLARQNEWFSANGSDLQGFMYDKQRRLKPRFGGFPIQECNDLCGCDEDCINRVVQRGRTVQVAIQKTEKKGWGVFAGPKKIPRGTFLGVYAGEILTSDDGEERGKTYERSGRTYLFDIDFYYLNETPETYTVDAYHAGNFTRFLNHSCNPNARLYPCYVNETCLAKALLVVFSTKDIEPHEEICFCYTGDYPEDEDGQEKNAEAPVIKRADWKTCYCEAANCKGIMFA